MYQLCVETIMTIIRFVYVLESLCVIEGIEIKKCKKLFYLFLYSGGYIILEKNNYQSYIFQYIYFFFVLYLMLNKLKTKLIDLSLYICIFLTIYEIISLIGSVLGTLVTGVLKNSFLEMTDMAIFFAFLSKSIILGGTIHILKKHNISLKLSFINQCLAGIIYLIVICVKIPFLYTDIRDAFEWKVIFLTIICCTVIFLIISKIEKHNAKQEMARIEENNKQLTTKLHKSREILPAMVQVLNNVTENKGVEMDEQEAHKLLQEVNDLYGQQLKENNKEDLQLKSFCSTGLKILDQQLSIYQREAIDKDVNFDIYVQAPINELLKRDNIDQLKLQRAVGDLIRNAFRVMEREDKKCRAKGHILLIIGCRYENILEISVVDNGASFPLYVIDTFGKRGVTTGGMGNGLADLVDFAKEIKASICLDEFEGRTNSFTKKISVIFDKKGINYFNSARRGHVTGPFWSTT